MNSVEREKFIEDLNKEKKAIEFFKNENNI